VRTILGMTKLFLSFSRFSVLLACLLAGVCCSAIAQDQSDNFERLQYIQTVLSDKNKTDLRRQADDLTRDIQQLRTTLENIAIGGVDTSLFVDKLPDKNSNWRQDITLIAQPVIDSLKELTEKPRKLKELNDAIVLHQKELESANEALANLNPELGKEPTGNLKRSLERLHKIWTNRRDDARSSIEIARFQIADLEGDKPMAQTVLAAMLSFITGRGLTLVMAAGAAMAIWFGVRFMLRGYRSTISTNDSPEQRTRYRLAAYSVHALTFLLTLIAVFVVFYERGDVLLLGVLILLIVGLALSIRQLLPQYLTEARLLLNIGAMREAERVFYRGLPWRVESINMYTVLRNPELHGVLRIPLAELHTTTSRPAGSDSWFPTQQVSVPTVEFYNKEMVNLSRGDSFGVRGSFGVDYRYQDICLTRVPKILRDAIRDILEASDLVDFIKDVRVELKEAGTSSIGFLLHVTMDSKAAKSYLRVHRMMQSACIAASAEQRWDIPYPAISLTRKDTEQTPIRLAKR